MVGHYMLQIWKLQRQKNSEIHKNPKKKKDKKSLNVNSNRTSK
jgi:hypothetical protein